MEVPEITYKDLDNYGYRDLQKMAKSMGLPSNVKKVYLIEMIIAKQYNSPDELEVIINRVKLDRLRVSQSRWSKRKIKRALASEVSSTSKTSPRSPSITITPKNSSYIIQYSPDTTQTIIKYQPKSYPAKKSTCDRVLRSYNTKTPRPNYAMMDDIAIYGSSFNTKNSVNMRPASSNTATYNTKIAHDYAITNHGSEGSFNTKVVKRIMDRSSILNQNSQNSSVLDHNGSVKKIMQHRNSILDQTRSVFGCSSVEKINERKYSILNRSSSAFDHGDSVKLLNCRSPILNQNRSVIEHNRSIKKVIERRNSILDQSTSMLGQSSSIINYNAKIIKPNLNTEVIRPGSSIVKTSYGIMDRNGIISKVVRGQNSVRVKTAVPKVVVRRESVLNSSVRVYNEELQMCQVRQSTNTSSKIPAKRKRTVSGIYPITSQENTYYECVQTVDYRHTDGKITKINALIQKPRPLYPTITVQDVINRKIESQIFKTSNNESTEQITKAIEYEPIITTVESDSSISKENIQLAKPYLNLSLEKTHNAMDYFDFSTNCTENTQPIRDPTNCTEKKDFAMDCTNNTQTARQVLDFSINNTQSARQYNDFSINNTQSVMQYNDFSINNTQSARQYNDFSIRCTANTQPVRQLIDTSSTPTYTNVTIKEMPDNGNISIYYHKKMRSEQIRHRFNEQNEVLPHINEVFSQFNEAQYRNLTQPLYVQVSQESERFPHCPILLNNQESGTMLESLYNFKQQLIVNEPLLKLSTTTNTKCVFTANTVVSAEAHPSSIYRKDTSYAPVDVYNSNVEAETRIYDYLRGRYHRDFTCNEVLSPTNSSIDTTNSRDLGANVTIPEMVEDALELISQDGDYLERIGLDTKMQCVVSQCQWVGSHLILEYHIRQAHQNDILYKEDSEWSIKLTLGSLASHEIWLSHVVHYNNYLYIVSAKYYKDCIMIALTTVTETNQNPKRGKITIYNKISGKPFVWENEIPFIPESMPYQCTENCLKIDTANLDLLPNSANLKLINNELKSLGNKVVIGQPSLNDIEIVLYIQIFE